MTKRPKLRLGQEQPAEEPAPTTKQRAGTTAPTSEPRVRTTAPSRVDSKFIGGHFPKSTWDGFRKLGIDLEKSGQELLQEAIDDLFAKYRKR
jgi:hypothetical protein